MMHHSGKINSNRIPLLIRRLLTGWVFAAAVEFFLLQTQDRALSVLTGTAQMSLLRLFAFTAAFFVLQSVAAYWLPEKKLGRWYLVIGVALLVYSALWSNTLLPFVSAGLLLVAIVIVYGIWGWDSTETVCSFPQKEEPKWLWIVGGLSLCFFLFVSVWTVCRVTTFCTPTFDFGIFSQMFYNMKECGIPYTTVERDGLLSHFAVHVSPIYYALLPFYCLVPRPETLQVLQAAVMTSAVIPLWLLGKHHSLPGPQRVLVCALLLLYPAFAGGVAYDIHENCFLTPLLLWLLYGIDKRNGWITAAAALLTFLVKEDAPVYVAIVGLYLLVQSLLYRRVRGILAGGTLMLVSVLYFFTVTGYLASSGDGVMTYRYSNFMYDGSDSLITVIKAVLLNPMKTVYECVDEEKLAFIAQTLLPLIGLPLLTRRYERFLLLIPYVLINLMPDYQYQHNIYFQYCFGSTACLLYLTLVNLSDLQAVLVRKGALVMVTAVCAGFFLATVVPTGLTYVQRQIQYEAYYDNLEDLLDQIPEDASVSASTFYTTYLSQREDLYDVRYCSRENLLSSEYVALAVSETTSYRSYGGYDGLIRLLENNGYELYANMGESAVIYRKIKS